MGFGEFTDMSERSAKLGWIEIPAHRIFAISGIQKQQDYETYSQKGESPCPFGEMVYRVMRKNDGKMFKPARFVPTNFDVMSIFYLEEL